MLKPFGYMMMISASGFVAMFFINAMNHSNYFVIGVILAYLNAGYFTIKFIKLIKKDGPKKD